MAEDTHDPVDVWRTFSNVSKTWFRLAEANLRPLGLSLLEVRALRLLSREGPQPMVRLSGELLVSQPAITGIVDRLQRQALALRVRDRDDRRVVYVRITPAGRRVLARAIAIHRSFVRESLGHLPPREAARLSGILASLGDALAAYEDARRPVPSRTQPHRVKVRR